MTEQKNPPKENTAPEQAKEEMLEALGKEFLSLYKKAFEELAK